jgi:hypothetical protein
VCKYTVSDKVSRERVWLLIGHINKRVLDLPSVSEEGWNLRNAKYMPSLNNFFRSRQERWSLV